MKRAAVYFSLTFCGQNGMRVTLMHNPRAGQGKHRKKELMDALAKAGHHATYQSTKGNDYKEALKKSTDLVLVGGGDGTVGKVGRGLIDSGVPLSVLPLGTANNLARSLGFTAPLEEIIARLEGGKKRPFDVGLARGPRGTRYFFESVGGGLLADYVRIAKGNTKKTKNLSKEQEMARHVALLHRMLRVYPARKWKIEIDGEDVSSRYILWEAMNIRSVGPVLYLASQAATRDGRLDFVCAREEDRTLLMEYLDARLAGIRSKFPLPLRRFRELKVAWENSTIHFDDKLWPRKGQKVKSPREIEITVKPSGLMILRPGALKRIGA
jgi:diacylglycerol kinase family enzyme